MIGIDCTSISRWKKFRPEVRKRMAILLKQDNTDPLHLAKSWACAEAMFKATGYNPNGYVSFEKRKPPRYVGQEKIFLSLTHEGDNVIAVALLV
jgi:phosphopantetheinyl transferase (holo-ACP synthase)